VAVKKTVARLIVDYLEGRDLRYVFGLTGHTVIPMLDALKDSRVAFVSVRHEQIAAHAADGYARVTGKAAVLLCHLGPGLLNAATGVANAALDSSPMVVIAGDVPSYYAGRHPHQEINLHGDAAQYEVFRPFVKRAWRLDRPELLPDILDRGFRLAESGRPGPVLISVPMDMFARELDAVCFDRCHSGSTATTAPSLPEDAAARIASMLVEAERPLVHVGGQVVARGASEALRDLVEFLDLPVTRSLMGQGALPDAHPLHVGMTGFWGTDFVHSISAKADLVLAVGTRFAEADCSSWYPGVSFDPGLSTFVQIDLDPSELGRNYPLAIGAVADPGLAFKAILAAARRLRPEGQRRPALRREIAAYKASFKAAGAALAEDGRFPMTPQRILREVHEVFPEDGVIVTDVGWNKNGVGQQYDISRPGGIHHPGGLATMGFGPAAALGVKLASPERLVVALVGDGGFGANPSVLATAVERGIAVVWVVMNNAAFGTIAGLSAGHYRHSFGARFTRPDGRPYSPEWAEVAKGYGVRGLKIGAAAEFRGAFKEALDSGEPFLLDVPMENIGVPTEGIWNINDIFTPKANVAEGRLLGGEAARFQHTSTK
jgi:acetolactate synthase-1/2/3 large subunit